LFGCGCARYPAAFRGGSSSVLGALNTQSQIIASRCQGDPRMSQEIGRAEQPAGTAPSLAVRVPCRLLDLIAVYGYVTAMLVL
jgi:hypothetical protein